MKAFYLLLSINIFLDIIPSQAQNLEEIGFKKGFDVTGALSINTIGYRASGIQNRRDPLNWFATGNLNVNLFGYQAPFSFSYSNANRSFAQPFNQFSFSPQYKWMKTYIGYSSMTFSNYTLAGHVFLGGGIELSPGKWRFSAMYGRLRKAVPFSLEDSLLSANASYRRMGYGLKAGYEDNGNYIFINVFTAKDIVNSIPFTLPESQLSPQQNIAASINFRKRILDHVFIEVEYALSSLNKDTRLNAEHKDTIDFKGTHNFIRGLLPENATNRYYDAIRSSIGYQEKIYSLQLKFEQIAPEYQSLGAYFFNNDMRNITLAPSLRLLKGTLTLSANAGIQQNNLDKSRTSTTKRVVASVNAVYAPNPNWNYSAGYSNFSSYTNVRPLSDPFFQNRLDTLNFYQVNQTSNISVLRNFGSTQRAQTISTVVSYQIADNNSESSGIVAHSDFISLNSSYSYSYTPTRTALALALNLYITNASGVQTKYMGPTLSFVKSSSDKTVRFSWASSYNLSTTNKNQGSPVLNNRLNVNYTPTKQKQKMNHNLTAGLNIMNRLKSTSSSPAFSEYTLTIGYNYVFQ
jgi:hypothetical protein